MATKRKESGARLDEDVRKTDIWLQALEDQDGLTEWETGFLESVTDWFYQKGKKLTPSQMFHLEKIYRKFY